MRLCLYRFIWNQMGSSTYCRVVLNAVNRNKLHPAQHRSLTRDSLFIVFLFCIFLMFFFLFSVECSELLLTFRCSVTRIYVVIYRYYDHISIVLELGMLRHWTSLRFSCYCFEFESAVTLSFRKNICVTVLNELTFMP